MPLILFKFMRRIVDPTPGGRHPTPLDRIILYSKMSQRMLGKDFFLLILILYYRSIKMSQRSVGKEEAKLF